MKNSWKLLLLGTSLFAVSACSGGGQITGMYGAGDGVDATAVFDGATVAAPADTDNKPVTIETKETTSPLDTVAELEKIQTSLEYQPYVPVDTPIETSIEQKIITNGEPKQSLQQIYTGPPAPTDEKTPAYAPYDEKKVDAYPPTKEAVMHKCVDFLPAAEAVVTINMAGFQKTLFYKKLEEHDAEKTAAIVGTGVKEICFAVKYVKPAAPADETPIVTKPDPVEEITAASIISKGLTSIDKSVMIAVCEEKDWSCSNKMLSICEENQAATLAEGKIPSECKIDSSGTMVVMGDKDLVASLGDTLVANTNQFETLLNRTREATIKFAGLIPESLKTWAQTNFTTTDLSLLEKAEKTNSLMTVAMTASTDKIYIHTIWLDDLFSDIVGEAMIFLRPPANFTFDKFFKSSEPEPEAEVDVPPEPPANDPPLEPPPEPPAK